MIAIIQNYGPDLLIGLKYTIIASLLALLGSLILGIFFALLEISPNKWLRFIGKLYVEVFRNIPLLVIVMFFYLIVSQFLFKMDGLTSGTLGLTIYSSAFIAETVKAGINSVDAGQAEAARSNGMTYLQAMRCIIFPQAIKIVIPPLGNQFINLVKNSSVLAFVAGFDLMYEARNIASVSFKNIQTFFLVGLMYLLLTLPLSYYMRHLERKWQK